MRRPKLVISRISFDADMLASALHVTRDNVITAFTDGRGAWPFSEYWGASLYEFIKHSNSNNPVSDGAVALGQFGDFQISIKALTKSGIKFQQSRDVGVGRTSSKEKLLASLEACGRVLAVDLTEFPVVSFLPIEATRPVSAVHRGELGTNGWSKAKVYAWLDATHDVSVLTLSV